MERPETELLSDQHDNVHGNKRRNRSKGHWDHRKQEGKNLLKLPKEMTDVFLSW